MKIPLFRSVKQINGDKMFRMLFDSCQLLYYPLKDIDQQLSLKQSFIYVKKGEVLVFKTHAEHK
jgi:hypothetical protein